MRQASTRYYAAAACVALLTLRAPAIEAQETPGSASGNWDFTFTPYLWAAGQNGSMRIGSRLPTQNVDASFSDILSNLDLALMASFEARQGRWGILADAMYIDLSKTSEPLLNGALGTATVGGRNTLVEAAGAYRVVDGGESWLDVLVGVRYFNLGANLRLSNSTLLPAGRYQSSSQDWTDGVVGLRARQSLSEHWAVQGYVDVGTGGSSLSYQLAGALAWDISRSFGLQLGYRLLSEDYNKTDLLYDMRTGGPYLGFSLKF
jgi:hypothetical protein